MARTNMNFTHLEISGHIEEFSGNKENHQSRLKTVSYFKKNE